MQVKWNEIFGEKEDEVVEEVKPKKPRKKAVASKKKVVKNSYKKKSPKKATLGESKPYVKKSANEMEAVTKKKSVNSKAEKIMSKKPMRRKTTKKARESLPDP